MTVLAVSSTLAERVTAIATERGVDVEQLIVRLLDEEEYQFDLEDGLEAKRRLADPVRFSHEEVLRRLGT